MQKQRYEVEARKISRQEPHPRWNTYTLAQARDFVKGVYYLEEEREEERMRGLANLGAQSHVREEPVLIGRDGLN